MAPIKVPTKSFFSLRHDHGRCIKSALAQAEQICRSRGARLTPVRRRVLELVWSSHEPIGAYDLLKRLAREQASAVPPTIYRALDFLLAQGLVHRIESLNSYIGCVDPGSDHAGHFLLCKDCGVATEIQDSKINSAITQGAAELGFHVEHKTVEVSGTCPRCAPRRGNFQDV